MSELNQKHPIKFDYILDCKQIAFLKNLVYIYQPIKLQTTPF